ncbi:MAG: 6-hydroxymethylpterin diphosphokinase MptE-like protein [Sulfolobales archaeon]
MIRYDIFKIYLSYVRILTDLGYDVEKEFDASSAACLMAKTIDLDEPTRIIESIKNSVRGDSAVILGAGPSIENMSIKELCKHKVILCANGVCSLLNDLLCKSKICIYVGDLDGGVNALRNILDLGGYAFIHFHGDNYMDLVTKLSLIIRDFREKVVFTVQSLPPCSRIIAIPGFTDGDRAIILTKILEIDQYDTIGMDLDDMFTSKYSKPWYREKTLITNIKRRKLEWGKRIIGALEKGFLI